MGPAEWTNPLPNQDFGGHEICWGIVSCFFWVILLNSPWLLGKFLHEILSAFSFRQLWMLRLVEETPQAKWASGICPIKIIGFTPHKEKSVLPLSHVFFQLAHASTAVGSTVLRTTGHAWHAPPWSPNLWSWMSFTYQELSYWMSIVLYSTIVPIISTWFHYISHGNLPRISKKPCRPKRRASGPAPQQQWKSKHSTQWALALGV